MSAIRSLPFGRVMLMAVSLCVVVGIAACSSGTSSPQQSPQMAGPTAPGSQDALTGQFTRGMTVYSQQCAKCHGAGGGGSAGAPALMGAGALPLSPPPGARMRNTQFNSAMELGMFIKNTMPPGGPATPPQDVAAVMVYILSSNGVPPSQAISPATAGSMRVRP